MDYRLLRMAARKMEIATAVFGLAMMMALASQATAQNNGCSSVMMTLSPCLDFIGSKTPDPGFSCCTTLAGIVQTDPRCLCMVLDGTAAAFGIAINHTKALELPGFCKVQAPPISQCTAVPAPTTAPPSSEPPDEPTEEVADPPKGGPDSNSKSSSRNSKNAASLMATILIPVCALLSVF